MLCQMTPEEAAALFQFLSTIYAGGVTSDDGESAMTTVQMPLEPPDEGELSAMLSAMLEALSAKCGGEGG